MSASTAADLLVEAGRMGAFLSDRLVAWQRQEGRHHLPWQQSREPYRVWLSEIMLQQTQVTTVLGYFDRFLKRFPDVRALAAAPLDDVLAMWSGLGYYSRARNLHRCAQEVVSRFGGEFPRSAAELETLPGIGPSTAAAVAAFCAQERISIMDGNVKRVLSRVLNWAQDLSVREHEKALWAAAQVLLPPRASDMPAYTQGLMDLGATLCTPRQPACLGCPWSDACLGRLAGDPARLPVKSRKLKRGRRESWWLALQWQDQVWLAQMPDKGVWAGLWTLPLFDSRGELASLVATVDATLAAQLVWQPPLKHVLTHLDWHLQAAVLSLDGQVASSEHAQQLAMLLRDRAPSGQWVARTALDDWGLPAPVRKLLQG
jgi:A/G-specific adenine glycosylase